MTPLGKILQIVEAKAVAIIWVIRRGVAYMEFQVKITDIGIKR